MDPSLVVDAKTTVDAHLNLIETDDDELRERALGDYLEQMRACATNLSSKQYWDQFESSLELAVMFVPANSLFMTAIDKDPIPVEWAAERRVFIASPIRLITVLKAIAIGWAEKLNS